MALQHTLRRMVSPTKNILFFCRAQSTGSAAIGILFLRKIPFVSVCYATWTCKLDQFNLSLRTTKIRKPLHYGLLTWSQRIQNWSNLLESASIIRTPPLYEHSTLAFCSPYCRRAFSVRTCGYTCPIWPMNYAITVLCEVLATVIDHSCYSDWNIIFLNSQNDSERSKQGEEKRELW